MVTGRKMPRAASQIRTTLALASLAAFCGLIGCPRVFALDPSLHISQFAHTAWPIRNGVYAFAQTGDGYLWLGTQSGLLRFDGARTTPLPLPPGHQRGDMAVRSLLSARDGTLWIGTIDGLLSWKNGRLTEHPAVGRRRVNALLQDRDGTVWAGTIFKASTGRLCAIRGESTQCYGDEGNLGAGVQSLYEDSAGNLWVGAANGLWRWKPGAPTHYLATAFSERQSLTQGDDASGLIVALGSLHQVIGTRVLDYPLPGVPESLTTAHALRDRNGALWLGSGTRGLVHSYGGKTSTFTHKEGLSSDQVEALFEDSEGTIWAGTSMGVDQFRQFAVTSLSTEDGLSDAPATSMLAARDGSLWIGTGDGLNRWKDGRVTIYRKRTHPDLADDQIESLFEDERGRIWVSTYHGLAIFENGTLTAVRSVPEGYKHGMASDNKGGLWLSLWFTSNDGLIHLLNGKIVEQVPWQKLGGPGTGGLVADADGAVWVGLDGGGVAYFHQGQIESFPMRDDRGVASTVTDLIRDRDGALWAATENGLRRIINGHVTALTSANGLPCNRVHWIIEDNSSSYWLYTQCGLLRVAAAELAAWVIDPKRTIQFMTFDDADGIRLVPSLSRLRPEVTKSSDGKIWFVNDDIVSFFDPARITNNRFAPPTHIEQLTADRKTYTVDTVVRLPPLVRNITIDYTAVSFIAPDRVHFKYQLLGQDPDWREAVNDRQVQYSNLTPGNYRFRVMASNNSGLWNKKGASLDFSIAPAYWQTSWFRALCVAALLAGLWLLYWLRVRQLAFRFDLQLEARVRERTQIARELHDTLLQSFNGALLRFRTAHKLLTKRPDEARQVLESAIDEARSALIEGREAVQGLRSSVVETNELSEAIRTLTEELADHTAHGRAVEVRLTTGGTSKPLRPLIRDEVYRIATEALRNAFRHSGASCIEVQLEYDARRFELHVRDDGKGIDPKLLSDEGLPGHFGLQGMRERAQSIGGKLTVSSGPGSGTQVALSVPATRAYGTAESNLSWLGRIFRDRREAKS
jgi:signal transduction histidine kinase/ligand-binding sensor domain-containing protein